MLERFCGRFSSIFVWEQRKLGEIVNYTKGFAFKSKDYCQTGVRLIQVSDLAQNRIKENNKIFLPNYFINKYKNFQITKGDILVTTMGSKSFQIGSAVGKAILATNKTPYLLNQNLVLLKSKYNPIFIFQQLQTKTFKYYILTIERGNANQANIAINDLLKFNIQITKNKEQKLISFIFEKINTLISLQQRKLEQIIQINNALIKIIFSDQNKWKNEKLSNLVKILDKDRVPVKRQDRIKGKIPYYGANGIQDYVNGYTHNGKYILIAEDGANSLINYPVYCVDGKIWVNNHAHVLKIKNNDNIYFLTTFLKQINYTKYVVGGSRSKLNLKDLKNILIKVPDIQIQNKAGTLFKLLKDLKNNQIKSIETLKFIKQFLLQNMFI